MVQPLAEWRLVAALQGSLPEPVGLLGPLRLLDAHTTAAPGAGQTAGDIQPGVALMQQPLPGQPHRQQMHDLRVVALGQACLPALVGTP